jgi:prepilin-type N-terminal cleavage/methylation domain-containing protein
LSVRPPRGGADEPGATVDRVRRAESGFTLIELLIIIIIIAILAAVALPMFLGQRAKAKDASVKEAVHTLQVGVQSYAVDHGDAYPTTGDLSVLKDDYVDAWPKDPFVGGSMAYSATAAPGSYAYVSTGEEYVLTGWTSNGSFQVPSPATSLVAGFPGQTSFLIQTLLDYYAKYGKWPRSWQPYNFTDLGLDPATYAAAIDGINYGAGGSKVTARPTAGYVMTATGLNGRTFVMTSNLNWNFVYDATAGKWYYHTISPENEVDISTLVVTKS